MSNNRMDKDKLTTNSGAVRQNSGSRKFIIVPATFPTTTAGTSVVVPSPSNNSNYNINNNTPGVNESANNGTQEGVTPGLSHPGAMGRSLKFHSMRSVRGEWMEREKELI